MVREGKANPPFSKELRERSKEDRISQLPDDLICLILSHLPTKKAVKTSVLSTRWRSLWLWLPSLVLKSWEFPHINAFVSFGDRFFDSNRVSCIQKLELTLGKSASSVDDASRYKSWIDAAVKRKIQHLLSHGYREKFLKMPQRLYSCKTLVCLELFEVILEDAEFVCLPCLKTMHLECIDFPNEATFETLVLGCPVLEDLKVVVTRDDAKAFRVHSRSLKRLSFVRYCPSLFDSGGVVINAPGLCCLYIKDFASKSFIVDNLDANAKLHMCLVFGLHKFDEASVSSRRSSIRSFLPGISMVRDMIIYGRTFELICQYTKLEPLPQFGCMSRLCVFLCVSKLEGLSNFLESCPNLKSLSLTLEWDGIREMSQISFSSVPECLLSSLESVDIILGYDVVETEVVRYFLENSKILKKLTLSSRYHQAIQDDFVSRILKIPRRSVACQVVVLGLEKTIENKACFSTLKIEVFPRACVILFQSVLPFLTEFISKLHLL